VQSALVVLVPEAEILAGAMRARHDPVAAHGMPAHVTVLYPFVPPPLAGDDRAALGALASSMPAFDFALTAVRRFPGVLWLAPEPAAPFVELTRRAVARWPQHPPYAGAHDGLVPHLTVAHGAGALFADLEQSLSAGLPIRGRARSLSLAERDACGRWTIAMQFPFAAR
jgi:2'-5' RNA ligase